MISARIGSSRQAPASKPPIRPRTALAIAIILIASLATDARSAVISYQYSGTIAWADASTGVAAGTPFSGTFTYDTSDASQNIGTTGYQSTLFGNDHSLSGPSLPSDSGMTLTIGGLPINSIRGGLGVSLSEPELGGVRDISGSPVQQTNLVVSSGQADNSPVGVSLGFTNLNRTVYSSLDLPMTINMADFPSAVLNVSVTGSDGSTNPLYVGTLDSFTPVAAPEPSALVLLGVGVAAWLARARRRAC